MLPDTAKVSVLQQEHADYQFYKDTWQTIEDIRNGATTIFKKIREYLPARPGEAPDIYVLRLAKASWTPVMSTAIREFTAKLASAPIHITASLKDYWEKFREDTNGKGRSESEFLNKVFSTLLYFGRCFVSVDKEPLPYQPRTKYEELQVGTIPYVNIYEPLSVINWSEGWSITRDVSTVQEPLQELKYIATWVVWTADATTTYQAEVKLDKDQISHVKVGSEWLNWKVDKAVAMKTSEVFHGLGKSALLRLVLPLELWTGNNVYAKQLQHFRIESSWTEAGVMAGSIQRVFTPIPPVPNDDPRMTFEEPDYAELKPDNAHVLIGADFKFQESSGSAIQNLTSQLETIERQIRAIVSMNQASVNVEALQQSGASKDVDQEPLEDTMKSYGTKVAKFYQDILELVELLGGADDEVSVEGLDSYGTDNLEDLLVYAETLELIQEKVPLTAQKIFYGKISNLLAGSRDAKTDAQIQAELDIIFTELKDAVPGGDEETMQGLLDMGLTPEEVQQVLET